MVPEETQLEIGQRVYHKAIYLFGIVLKKPKDYDGWQYLIDWGATWGSPCGALPANLVPIPKDVTEDQIQALTSMFSNDLYTD